MIKANKRGVIFNPYQGKHTKILTVCSAGCLRSPTAAHILSSDPYNFNTRCAGISKEYAIIHVDEVLVTWADIIICMDLDQVRYINDLQSKIAEETFEMFEFKYRQVINLNIEDDYAYRDSRLVKIMTEKFKELFPQEK